MVLFGQVIKELPEGPKARGQLFDHKSKNHEPELGIIFFPPGARKEAVQCHNNEQSIQGSLFYPV